MSKSSARSLSLVEQVAEGLADRIRRQPPENDRQLPAERMLAEEFGVGRGVVREAIKRLEIQGLVEVRQGSGVRVVDNLHRPLCGSLEWLVPDAADRLRQLNEARLAIEPDVARLAALRATPEQVASLRETHERLLSAEEKAEAISADHEFHRTLADISGNLMFRLILDSLAEIGMESRRRTIGHVGKQIAIAHHTTILEAVAAGLPDSAASAMREHIQAAARHLEEQHETT